jgi:hypothetical protein
MGTRITSLAPAAVVPCTMVPPQCKKTQGPAGGRFSSLAVSDTDHFPVTHQRGGGSPPSDKGTNSTGASRGAPRVAHHVTCTVSARSFAVSSTSGSR